MIQFREVHESDSQMLFEWRNDPVAVMTGWTQKPVTEEEHAYWMAEMISVSKNPSQKWAAIAEITDGVPVGVVRLWPRTRGILEVSINVAPEHRGQGYGTQILQEVRKLVPDNHRLLASIRLENVASRRAFEKAGYKVMGVEMMS